VARVTQHWLGEDCLDFSDENSRLSNSPELKLLNHNVCFTVLEDFNNLNTEPQNIVVELILQKIGKYA